MAKFVDKIKANPMVSAALAFVFVVGAVSGVVGSVADVDSWFVSHAEFDEVVVPLSDQVEENKQWNQCHRLELQLDRLKDRLWERQQANADPQAIRDIETDIEKVEREFRAKNCSEILDGQ